MKIGDKVVMNDKYYVSEENKGRVWTVRSEPWKCSGTLVVLLDGKSGGYAVGGLDIIEEAESNMTRQNLEQFYYLERELEMWERELLEIKTKPLISSPSLDMIKSSIITDKVSEHGNKTADLELNIKQRRALIKEICSFIDKIPDACTRTIVTSHCKNADNWEKTLEVVGKGTLEGIQKKYYRFLKKFFKSGGKGR